MYDYLFERKRAILYCKPEDILLNFIARIFLIDQKHQKIAEIKKKIG